MLLQHRGRSEGPYFMCLECGEHNARNRNAEGACSKGAEMRMPSMTLVTESVSFFAALKQFASRIRTRARHLFCVAVNGNHELYRARSDAKLFQQCLLCGYETKGWSIDRRDRRLHLVANRKRAS